MKFSLLCTLATSSLVSSLLVACTSSAVAADLTVVVKDVKNTDGKILVALYNKADGFPRIPFLKNGTVASVGQVQVVFKDLPAGEYALSAFQDKNGNEKLDTNSMGIPNEPLGFSEDAKGKFGPPDFADARFKHTGTALTKTITLK